MKRNKTIDSEIIMDVKKLLISDGTLSYGERKTFEKFLVQISEGVEFEEAIGVLLRGLNNLINKESLSSTGKKIFSKAHTEYEIASPPSTGGGALHPRLTNREWIIMLLGLILFLVLLFVIKKPSWIGIFE